MDRLSGGTMTPEERSIYMRAYRNSMTPDEKAKQLAAHRRWYARNRTQNVQRVIAWRKKNTDKTELSNKRYRERHREEVNARMRRWHASRKPESVASKAARHHRRRALEKSAPGKFSRDDVLAQLKRQKNLCYWCNEILHRYHIDHWMPLSRGGSNGADNIVLACAHCNLSKRDKLPSEFAGLLL